MTVALLAIDLQNDFCRPNGALFVPGADRDAARLAHFIQHAKLDALFLTLDTHAPLHIAHPTWWTDPQGQSPAPFTTITPEDVVAGRWTARRPDLQDFFLQYVQKLQDNKRYQLTVWPEHCLLGTPGHALVAEVAAAVHAWERTTLKPARLVLKGMNPFTEHYSALRADVEIPDDPATGLNRSLIDDLKRFDKILVAGEALSHCVANTVRDLAKHVFGTKIALLCDTTSAVDAPGCDALVKSFFTDMITEGMEFTETEKWIEANR